MQPKKTHDIGKFLQQLDELLNQPLETPKRKQRNISDQSNESQLKIQNKTKKCKIESSKLVQVVQYDDDKFKYYTDKIAEEIDEICKKSVPDIEKYINTFVDEHFQRPMASTTSKNDSNRISAAKTRLRKRLHTHVLTLCNEKLLKEKKLLELLLSQIRTRTRTRTKVRDCHEE
jgi:hypothetical protein